jgi:hypothetical protein
VQRHVAGLARQGPAGHDAGGEEEDSM